MERKVAIIGPGKSGKSSLIEMMSCANGMKNFTFVEYEDGGGKIPGGEENLIIVMCTLPFEKWESYMDYACQIYPRWRVLTVFVGSDQKGFEKKAKDVPIGTFLVTNNKDIPCAAIGQLTGLMKCGEKRLRGHLKNAEREFDEKKRQEMLSQQRKKKRQEKREKKNKKDEDGWSVV